MSLIFSAWPLITRRSLANWKLLSSIVVGVLVAVALLSSTPLFSNALNDLGLLHALREKPIELLNVHIYAPNHDVYYEDYQRGSEFIDQQVSKNIGTLLNQKTRHMQSEGFYAAWNDRPIPTDPTRPRGHFQFLSGLEEHIILADGRYPEPLSDGLSQEELTDPGLEIEAMIGSETARTFEVGVGDRILFRNELRGDPPIQITVKLTGIIDPIDPDEEYWMLNTRLFTVPITEEQDYITVPLFIPEETFFEGIGRIVPFIKASYHWYYYLDLTQVNTQNTERIKAAIPQMGRQIAAELPRSTQFTTLGTVIDNYQRKLLFTQIPLFLLVFQIAGIILYYLVTVANMVIEQQSGEIALLRGRGATTGQIFSIFFMEGLLISAFGGIVGPFLGALIFSFLGKTTAFLPLTGGGFLPIRFTPSVFLLAAGGALLCLLALLVPAIQAARRSVVQQRQNIARPSKAPFWQRLYLDVVMLAIGGVLYWEMKERGSLLTQDIFGGLGLDPVLLVTPMLFMLAVAIVFLRLFPILISLAAKLGNYVTNASVVLSLRYMARNPTHYGRLILLLMMAASVGMFSASFLGTLKRSYVERAMYSAGSEVRLEELNQRSLGKTTLFEDYSNIPGVENLSIVYREGGSMGGMTNDGSFTLLAVDPKNFEQVTWYRDDFSEQSLPELMSLLADDQLIKEGLDLPEGTERIGVWVRMIASYPELRVYARIKDGLGHYTDYKLGTIGPEAAEEWQYLESSLGRVGSDIPPPSPLSISFIYVIRGSGRSYGSPKGIYFDDLQVKGSFSAEPLILEDFEDISEWTVYNGQESSGRMSSRLSERGDNLKIDDEVVHNGEASGKFEWVPVRGFTYKSIYPNLDARPLVVLVSRSFLESTGSSLGKEIIIRMPGQFMPVKIGGVVDYFPTLNPAGGFALANIDRTSNLRSLMVSGMGRFYPNEVWLTLSNDKQKRTEALNTLSGGRYGAKQLYYQQEMIAESETDPLVAAGWGGVLLLAFIGVILVSGLGFVVYAYLSAQRRQLEFAILRTLGFSLRQIIGLVSFEQIFVIGSGMGLGTLIGLRLSTIMMPFLQLTEQGEKVLPPFAPVIDWFTIGIAYVILAVAFIVTISLVILFFSRIAVHRALRMGDE